MTSADVHGLNNLSSISHSGKLESIIINVLVEFILLLQGFLTVTVMTGMLKILPFIQGYASLLSFALFPFTILVAFITNKPKLFLEFFVILFWIKSMQIMWDLINFAALYRAHFQGLLNPDSSWIWERAYFNIVTSVMLIMSPILCGFMIKGSLQAMGQISSAMTLNLDKFLQHLNKLKKPSFKK
jgi:hypothetical protein